MLPFVMLPRPLQESGVIGKGGTAGFLGAAFDPYYLFQDPNTKVSTVDLSLRDEVNQARMERRANMLDRVDAAMPEIEKAVSEYALGTYDHKALELILSGKARERLTSTPSRRKLATNMVGIPLANRC